MDNFWLRLCIDEININNEVYTILSNPVINKIVAIIPWVKANLITSFLRDKISYEKRLKVKEVTLDMSQSMDWIVTELFPQAKRTLDRYHVTSNVLEDIQSVRMRIKTIIKKEELEIEEQSKIDRKKYIPAKFENTETRLDFITRLRYQLFKRRKDWNEFQITRWEVLKRHEEFYDIKISYEILEKFYDIYDSDITSDAAKILFQDWFKKISQYENIIELQNSWRTIKNHLEWILGYFWDRSTNAFAEWLHSRIRRVLSNFRWFKNPDYMFYRITRIFA